MRSSLVGRGALPHGSGARSFAFVLLMGMTVGLFAAPEALAQIPAPFFEDFSDNSAGWTLGTEWAIGPATASPSLLPFGGYGDPGTDFTPTADNGVAGMVIGGNITTALHGYYYLTSPVIDTTTLSGPVGLSFRR